LIRSSCADASNKKRGEFLLTFPFGGERENRLGSPPDVASGGLFHELIP